MCDETSETPARVVRAVEAPYGQAWRIDPAGAGGDIARSDLSDRIRDDRHFGNGEVGHVGTRLTLQADVEARQAAREQAGWDRFVLLANLRNLELAGKVVVR
jgi:hypothetical protein